MLLTYWRMSLSDETIIMQFLTGFYLLSYILYGFSDHVSLHLDCFVYQSENFSSLRRVCCLKIVVIYQSLNFIIPSGDLYRVIVAVYLLQLYQNRSRLLGYINRNSPLGHLLGDPLGHPLRYPLRYPLGHPLGHPLQA